MTDEKFLTPKEVAKILKVSYETALVYFKSPYFPCFRVGNQYRVSETAFYKFIEKQSKSPLK